MFTRINDLHTIYFFFADQWHALALLTPRMFKGDPIALLTSLAGYPMPQSVESNMPNESPKFALTLILKQSNSPFYLLIKNCLPWHFSPNCPFLYLYLLESEKQYLMKNRKWLTIDLISIDRVRDVGVTCLRVLQGAQKEIRKWSCCVHFVRRWSYGIVKKYVVFWKAVKQSL